jgi:hypothetical protein
VSSEAEEEGFSGEFSSGIFQFLMTFVLWNFIDLMENYERIFFGV